MIWNIQPFQHHPAFPEVQCQHAAYQDWRWRAKNKMTNNITTTTPWIPGTNLYNTPWMPGTTWHLYNMPWMPGTTCPGFQGQHLYNMPWMPGTMDSRDNITTQCQGQNTKLKIYSKTNPGCQSSTTNKLNIIFMDLTSLAVGNHAGFDLGLPLRCCQLLTSGDALILQAVGVPGQVVFFGVNPQSS